jgi:hypothetical protein
MYNLQTSWKSINVLMTCFYTFSEMYFYFVELHDQKRKKEINYVLDKVCSLFVHSGMSELSLRVVNMPLYIVIVCGF